MLKTVLQTAITIGVTDYRPSQRAENRDNFESDGRRDWIRTNDPHHVKVVL